MNEGERKLGCSSRHAPPHSHSLLPTVCIAAESDKSAPECLCSIIAIGRTRCPRGKTLLILVGEVCDF